MNHTADIEITNQHHNRNEAIRFAGVRGFSEWWLHQTNDIEAWWWDSVAKLLTTYQNVCMMYTRPYNESSVAESRVERLNWPRKSVVSENSSRCWERQQRGWVGCREEEVEVEEEVGMNRSVCLDCHIAFQLPSLMVEFWWLGLSLAATATSWFDLGNTCCTTSTSHFN